MSNSADPGALPDYLIIGAQKAGTNFLFHCLRQHPQIMAPSTKEVHYFDLNHHRGPDWYRGHFPQRSELMRTGSITGEASPYYLFHPKAVQRARQLLPDARIVVSLRDPVQRAISHYYHARKYGFETLPLLEALAAEEERIDADAVRSSKDPRFRGVAHQEQSYKSRGIYVDQLRPWVEAYGWGRVHVLVAEELFSDSAAVLHELFAFLGVDASFTPPELVARGQGNYDQAIPDGAVDSLRRFFAPHNRRLCAYLGRDIAW